jgi:hypothetical protein
MLGSGAIFNIASLNIAAPERVLAELSVANVIIDSHVHYIYVHCMFGLVQQAVSH